MSKKLYTKFLATTLFVFMIAITGCSDGNSQNIVTMNGTVDTTGLGKEVVKTVEAAAGSIGSVSAVDAFTGATVSTASVDIIPNSATGKNEFSGLKLLAPSSKTYFVLVAKLTTGSTVRSIIPYDPGTPSSNAGIIGPISEGVVSSVENASINGKKIGIVSGAALPTGTTYATVATAIQTIISGAALPTGTTNATVPASVQAAGGVSAGSAMAKNIILIIADGMQLEHERAANNYLYGTAQTDEMVSPRFPNRRLCAMMEIEDPIKHEARGDQDEDYHCWPGLGKKCFSRSVLQRALKRSTKTYASAQAS